MKSGEGQLLVCDSEVAPCVWTAGSFLVSYCPNFWALSEVHCGNSVGDLNLCAQTFDEYETGKH